MEYCYCRRKGKGWALAEEYMKRALSTFLSFHVRSRVSGPMVICTTRPDGSLFRALFLVKNQGIYSFQEQGQGQGQEEEQEEEQEVEMMMCAIRLPGT
jgi:hypothetical protein